MLSNPELKRHIWLDFTTHRVLLTPIIIALILYISYLSGGASYQSAANAGYYIAYFFIFFWGTLSASEVVIKEINERTWDFQRQFTISPWTMTLGKVFGATIYTWFGASIALFAYIIFSSTATVSSYPTTLDSPLRTALILVLGGIFTHTLTVLLSIQILPQIRNVHTNGTFRYFFVGFIIGTVFTNSCLQAHQNTTSMITWYQFEFSKAHFMLLSLVVFLFWSLCACQRSFCKELQYPNVPWVWLTFNLFCILYFVGLVPSNLAALSNIDGEYMEIIKGLLHNAPYYLASSISLLFVYLALFTENLDAIHYRKLILRFKEKQLHECLQLVPWWSISFFISIITCTICVFTQSTPVLPDSFSLTVLLSTSLLYVTRDISIFHYFFFKKHQKRAFSSALLYLFILYFLTPILFSMLHLRHWYPLILPSFGQNNALAFISISIQIALITTLVYRQWLANWQEDEEQERQGK